MAKTIEISGENKRDISLGIWLAVNDDRHELRTADLDQFLTVQRAVNGVVDARREGEAMAFTVRDDAPDEIELEDAEFNLLAQRVENGRWSAATAEYGRAARDAVQAAKNGKA